MAMISIYAPNKTFTLFGFTVGDRVISTEKTSNEFLVNGMEPMLTRVFNGSSIQIKHMVYKEMVRGCHGEDITSMEYIFYVVVYSEKHQKHFCLIFSTDEVYLGTDSEFEFQLAHIYVSNSEKDYRVQDYYTLNKRYTICPDFSTIYV